MASSSADFVAKLFNILEGNEFPEIIRWNLSGDCFLIFDVGGFSTKVLPRYFKHANFASFVRQLNKYDFHKIRQSDLKNSNKKGNGSIDGVNLNIELEDDDSVDPSNIWIFKHEKFRAGGRHELNHIKRKVTKGTKGRGEHMQNAYNDSDHAMQLAHEDISEQRDLMITHSQKEKQERHLKELYARIESLQAIHKLMEGRLSEINSACADTVNDMLQFHKNMISQNTVIQNLISSIMTCDAEPNMSAREKEENCTAKVKQLIEAYRQLAQQSFQMLQQTQQRAAHVFNAREGHVFGTNSASVKELDLQEINESTGNVFASLDMLSQFQKPLEVSPPAVHIDDHIKTMHENGIDPKQVLSDHMKNSNTMMTVRPINFFPTDPILPNSIYSEYSDVSSGTQSPPELITQWIRSPKVLLAEDDAVLQKITSKFLRQLGCFTEIAGDGVVAVKKMETNVYDVVLMDSVMPNLDGVTASSLIRKFNTTVPIIGMAGEIDSKDLIKYFLNGMNDVIFKPFTKTSLFSIMEKYILHLER